MYNFYSYIILINIIYIYILNIKKDLLKTIPLIDYFSITGIIYIINVIFIGLIYNGRFKNPFLSLNRLNKNDIIKFSSLLFLIPIFFFLTSFTVIKEKVLKFGIFKQSIFIILLLIISIIYRKKIPKPLTIFGILLVLIGLYFIDKENGYRKLI